MRAALRVATDALLATQYPAYTKLRECVQESNYLLKNRPHFEGNITPDLDLLSKMSLKLLFLIGYTNHDAIESLDGSWALVSR